MNLLAARLVVGLALVAGFLGALWVDGGLAPWHPVWLAIGLTVGALCAFEVVEMAGRAGLRPSRGVALGGTLAVVGSNWGAPISEAWAALGTTAPAVGLLSGPPNWAAHLAWPALAFVGALMVGLLWQGAQFRAPGGTIATLAGTTWVVAYVGLLGSFVVQHRWLSGGMAPLLMLVAVAKGSDTGAYAVGRLFGRRKLVPRISPNKTVEGAIGGLVFGVLFALAIAGLAALFVEGPPFLWERTIGYGLVVGTAAQLGDLMESMIKRDCATKDASRALPGFGGVLDVFDSVLFAAPVSMACWWLWWP